MMKQKLIYGIIFSVSFPLLVGCYDTVLEYEGNSTTINSDDGTSSSEGELSDVSLVPGFLRTAQMRVIDTREHKYQYQCSFIGDDPVGYMSAPHSFDNRLKSSLAFYGDFAGGPQANMEWVAQQTVPVMRSVEKLNIAPLGAFASILFSDEALQFTNTHGPMPLNDFKNLKDVHPLTYEKQSDVYTQLFIDLIKADSVLAAYQNNPGDNAALMNNYIVETDMITQKSDAASIVTMWRKYANSLILRMAMTLCNVPDYTCNINGVAKTVQQLAEEAVQRGVLEVGDGGIRLLCGSGTEVGYHPLYKIANNWVDARLNASYHNYLVRTNHPILEFWFAKNEGRIVNMKNEVLDKEQRFLSIRSGLPLSTAGVSSQTYQYYSKFNLNFAGEPLYLFKTEEVLFLRAEGALRGWTMGGTDEYFYNEGIKEFLRLHSLETKYDDYMAWKGIGDSGVTSEKKQEAIYVDWYDEDNNLPLWGGYYKLNNSYGLPTNADTNPDLSGIDMDSKEIKLQKIITQKWIALFPMSLVAWTDYRRTGYPVLIPACPFAYSYSDGSLTEPRFNWNTGEIISEGVTMRRIPYNTSLSEVQDEVNLTAVGALNEETTGEPFGDKQGTRLWWDRADRGKLE